MAIDTSSLSALIQEFRALQTKDSVTPNSLGFILKRIVDLFTEVADRMTSLFATVTAAEDAVEAMRERSAEVENELFIANNSILELQGVTATTTQAVDGLNTAVAKGAADIKAYGRGRALYDDPTFRNGHNSVGGYLRGLWIRALTADAPNDSGYAIYFDCDAATARGCGGLVHPAPAAPNKEYIHRLIAKFPKGYTMHMANNSVGKTHEEEWLTPAVGTGEWEEYIYRIKCGSTGTFSAPLGVGYVWFDGPAGTPEAPVRFYVAYSSIFDMENVCAGDINVSAKTALFGDMWSAICAPHGRFNRTTGLFELNGLTDITYDEAQAIYAQGVWRFPYAQPLENTAAIRTNILAAAGSLNTYDKSPDISMLVRNNTLEVLRVSANNDLYGLRPANFASAKQFIVTAPNLRAVKGTINLMNVPKGAVALKMVESAPLLEELNLRNVKCSLDLTGTPALSLASLKYLVDNSANTETLHSIVERPEEYGDWYSITVKVKGSLADKLFNNPSDEALAIINNYRSISFIR